MLPYNNVLQKWIDSWNGPKPEREKNSVLPQFKNNLNDFCSPTSQFHLTSLKTYFY